VNAVRRLPPRLNSNFQAEYDVSRPFDEDDEELEEALTDGLLPIDGAPLAPLGEPVEEEVWDEADFDEDFDEDFDAEPDEDLEKFERELDTENIHSDKEPDEFEEDDF